MRSTCQCLVVRRELQNTTHQNTINFNSSKLPTLILLKSALYYFHKFCGINAKNGIAGSAPGQGMLTDGVDWRLMTLIDRRTLTKDPMCTSVIIYESAWPHLQLPIARKVEKHSNKCFEWTAPSFVLLVQLMVTLAMLVS